MDSLRYTRTRASCSGSLTGSSFNKTTLTRPKIAVLAPIPNARVNTTPAVKPGFLNSTRMPYRRSLSIAVSGSCLVQLPISDLRLLIEESLYASLVTCHSSVLYSHLNATIGSTFVDQDLSTVRAEATR